MKKSVLTLLLLGLLLMITVAPFSALAMLMIVVLVSGIFWTLSTMWQVLLHGEAKDRA